MADRHGAEPGAQEVHGCNAEANVRDGRNTHIWQKITGQVYHRHDRVEGCQWDLANAGINRTNVPLMRSRDNHERMPDFKTRHVGGLGGADNRKDETHDEHEQSVGKLAIDVGDDQCDEGDDRPDAIVGPGRVDPAQWFEHAAARRDDQGQTRADLDTLDNGDWNHI